MLNVPNYIENTELENIVDNLSLNFSIKKSIQLKYKQIFNLIYNYYILDKSFTNQFNFTEIPTHFFKKITHRLYKKILVHMYDNNLIFTNISMHKNSCGFNFKNF